MRSLSTIVSELRRRRVFRVAAVYAIVGWAVVEVSATVFPALQLPDWTITLIVILAVMGFPVALALAWAFDITPSGVERTPSLVLPPADSVAAEGSHRASAENRATLAPAGRTIRGGAIARPAAAPGTRINAGLPAPGGANGPGREGPAPERPPTTRPADPERVHRASLAHLRHELRTPINAILGYSEMLIEDAEEAGAEEVVADLGKIRAAGKQLLASVDRLLHPDGTDPGLAAEEIESVGSELRHELTTPITTVIGFAEIVIEAVRESDHQEWVGDLERIRDAAKNLLGQLDSIVRLSLAQPVSGALQGELSGIAGMAREVLDKIEPLPADRTGDQTSGASLLVVDDNETNRDLLGRQLARQGFSVRTAADGQKALDTLAAQDFDLVLLDIMMPEVDGVEVLRRMKSDPGLRDVPVIMISALDEIDSVVRCIQLGASDYLTKPFDPTLLQARIGASLEVRRLRESERVLGERVRNQQEFSEWLLAGLVPGPVAERVREGSAAAVELFPETTVLSAEIDGFRRAASRGRAAESFTRLSDLIDEFDRLTRARGLVSLPGASDSYTVVAGAYPPGQDSADAIAGLALDLIAAAGRIEEESGEALRVQIGIHTGALVAGTLDTERLVYGAWGEAIEIARGLQASAAPGCIQVSPVTHSQLRERYRFLGRGVIDVPGAGQMKSYLLQGPLQAASAAGI
jgi:adenylate cyclase